MKAISATLLAAAGMTLATPAFAWSPDVDFRWYANVGNGARAEPMAQPNPPPRPGYIWAPARWVTTTGTTQVLMPGVWIEDDYDRQWRAYANGYPAVIAAAPLEVLDRDGNAISVAVSDYRFDSARW